MKFALITGASGGIGLAIATKLAQDGFSLYLHYYKNEQKILELEEQLLLHNIQIIKIKADLSHSQGTAILLNQIQHPIEVIVHNCGTSIYGLVTDLNEIEINQQIQLHLTSPLIITKALLSKMIAKQRGNIIFITSIWGQTGASCEVLYSTVKGGQNTLVKALAKEVAPSGIRINGIAPGAIKTNMLKDFSPEDIVQLEDEIPIGRLGKPEEIADVVQFLTSEKASYITGQIISVNGGWYC